MSDPDRLAEITAHRSELDGQIAPWARPYRDDIDWLIGEVQDRRTDLAVALSQLQDAVGEIARLRRLLEPTSPTVTDPEREETPADPRRERRAP